MQIPVISHKECQTKYRKRGRKDLLLQDRVLCAGFKSFSEDTCQEKGSGGPILMRPIFENGKCPTY